MRFEAKLDATKCGACGACCRKGSHRVEVSARDAIQEAPPAARDQRRLRAHVAPPGGRCLALEGEGQTEPYLCRVYPDRAKDCADFAIAGDACLEARRRVGRSS